MLSEKSYKAGDVITIKITSGEELVATLVEDGPMHLKLKSTVVLTMTQDGIKMVPYLFTVDLESAIKIAKLNVTVIEKSDDAAAKQYLYAIDPEHIKDYKNPESSELKEVTK